MHLSAEELVKAFRDDGCWVTIGDMVKRGALSLHATRQTFYKYATGVGKGQVRLLQGTGGDTHTTLALTPNADVGGLDPRKLKQAYSKTSTLLHASRFDPNSARLHAVHVSEPCIGDGWTPMAGVSPCQSKGLSVFLNSTIHRINLLMCFSMKLKYPRHEPSAVEATFVPNIWDNPDMLEPLVTAHDRTSDMEVPLLRYGHTEIRQIWDKAVARTIKTGKGKTTYEQIRSWAETFAQEPLPQRNERQKEKAGSDDNGGD